ncbi:MAG: PAQR family membrane homeostasis protein TrhA [Paracoccaceae bacterium]
MTATTYPSPIKAHRKADMAVHITGLLLIFGAGGLLLTKAAANLNPLLISATLIYVACALASNLASWAYHFAPWHSARKRLRRIDHAAIYLSISGTFTPFFIQANTRWSLSLLAICWALTALAIWKKVTDENVKSRWSTASYLGLGAIGLCAIPDLRDVPAATLWCILAGAGAYVFGTLFYARKSMPFRYAIWHQCVTFGAVFMYAGIWLALF